MMYMSWEEYCSINDLAFILAIIIIAIEIAYKSWKK